MLFETGIEAIASVPVLAQKIKKLVESTSVCPSTGFQDRITPHQWLTTKVSKIALRIGFKTVTKAVHEINGENVAEGTKHVGKVIGEAIIQEPVAKGASVNGPRDYVYHHIEKRTRPIVTNVTKVR